MSIFGAPSTGIGKTAPDAKLRVQTSVFGKPRPIVYGQVRIAGNLVQYGDFVATQQSSGSGGGKGGGGSSGGKGAAGSGSYTYKAAIMIGICEGPVTFTGAFWNNGAGTAFPDLGLGGYNGEYLQTGWPYWNSAHSATSLNYKGLAFVAAGPMDLGTSSTIPQLTFEVTGSINGAISGSPDADPAAVIPDFLANAHYGMGFPSAFIGNFSQYSAWCIANGLVVSPLIETQGEGRAFIQDMMTATCSEMVWDGAHLTVVPYADSSVTGNSITFTPNGVQFSLTDNDFLLPQGGNPNSAGTGSADPVQSNLNLTGRKNQVTVEFIDRANNYNPDPVVVQDDAHIQEYGIRPQDKKSFHLFALRSAAVRSAQLLLGRETVVTTYTFTVGSQYARLLPMDLIEITDAVLGLYAVVVRITEISENSDYSLTITGQEVPDGISTAPIHASQNSNSFSAGYNDAPGSTNHVLIWEPPVALAGAYEVWIAAAGNYNWSGAQVWVSTDDATFRLVGTLEGASRLGYTTNTLVSATVGINSGQSVIVDMTTSGAAITAGTHADALNGNTLSYISDGSTGEYIAFSDAALGSGETYTLGYLNRGMYNTKPISRTSGQHFVRVIDGGFLRFSLTTDRIGSTLHFKVLPFNQYGGGLVKLSDVTSIAYTPSGTSPSIPTGLAAAGGSHQITVIWNWSSQPDVDHVEIWRLLAAPSATPSNNAVAAGATLITQVYAASYTDTSVALGTPGTTGHYWIRYVAVTGVVSDWLGPVHATTAALTALDIADGILTTAKFASSISPVGLVSTMPSGYTAGNPQIVYNTADSKLYRWTGSAWVTSVASTDIAGILADAQIAGMDAAKLAGSINPARIADGTIAGTKFASSIKAPYVIANTGVAGIAANDLAVNSADSKLYRWTGSAWIAVVNTADLSGMITDAQIAGIAATKLTTLILHTNIGDGEISTPKLAAGAVVAASIAAGAVTASKLTLSAGNMVADTAFRDTSYWRFETPTTGWWLDTGGIAGILGMSPAASLWDGGFTGTGYVSFASPYNSANGISAVPGTAYTLSARGYNSGNKDINVALIFFDVAGTYLSSASVVWAAGASTVTTKRVQVTAPAGATTISIVGEVHAGASWSGNAGIGGITVVPAASAEMIVDGTITAGKIAVNTITADRLVANSITAGQIQAGAISATEIAAGAVTAAKIAAGTITATELSAGSVTTAKIAAGAVTALTIAAGTITGDEIAANTLTADKLLANSITAGQIAAGAIGATEIAAGSIHASRLAADFALANSAQIGVATILSANIADLQVGTLKVASGAISYFASAYNEYVWTPSGTYGADGSCTVSITITDANEIVLILFKTITEYTDHASGVVTGSTGGAGSGTNGSELGGPG
jgi:hypothetical protein